MANIQLDGKARVWSNGSRVKVKRAYGALRCRQGSVLCILQGESRIRDESDSSDSDVQNAAPITLK